MPTEEEDPSDFNLSRPRTSPVLPGLRIKKNICAPVASFSFVRLSNGFLLAMHQNTLWQRRTMRVCEEIPFAAPGRVESYCTAYTGEYADGTRKTYHPECCRSVMIPPQGLCFLLLLCLIKSIEWAMGFGRSCVGTFCNVWSPICDKKSDRWPVMLT